MLRLCMSTESPCLEKLRVKVKLVKCMYISVSVLGTSPVRKQPWQHEWVDSTCGGHLDAQEGNLLKMPTLNLQKMDSYQNILQLFVRLENHCFVSFPFQLCYSCRM